jgi:branched-subunit amino acid transport protein
MRELVIVLLVGLGTYTMRVSFIAFAGDRQLPESVVAVLGHAKHAVLAALTVGFVSSGHTEVHVAIGALVAAAVATFIVKHPLAPLGIGLGVAFLLAAA